MELFLQIVGGFMVAIVLSAIAAYVYFKFKFGKYLNFDVEANKTPLHIHLNEDVSPDWLNKPAVKKTSTEFEANDFVAGKSYSIHEMEGYLLQVFHRGPVVAVMYWHDIAGCWVDMVAEEIDGIEYTVSNAPMGGEMSERPESIKVFDKAASVAELSEKISAIVHGSNKSFLCVNSDNFREYYEAAFKKDISWKNRNGGISFEEFTATEEKESPFRNSKKTIEEGFIKTKEMELDQWHHAAVEEYRRVQGIHDEDFYETEQGMLIVPFTTNATAFIRYLASQCFVKDSQVDRLVKACADESDIQKIFNKLNNLLSPELRAIFVCDIDYPLSLKIYRMSEKM